MRQTLNENPVLQLVIVGVLVIAAGMLLATRVLSQGGSSESSPPTETSAPAGSSASGAPTAPGEAEPAPGPAEGAAAAGSFVVGPGLPAKPVVSYARGRTVVLLVHRWPGRDDRKVRRLARPLAAVPGVSLTMIPLGNVARYARITGGVDVTRTPALVVLEPRAEAVDPAHPRASVAYGFREVSSMLQAIRDARYGGREDLPYHPGR